MNSAFGRFPCVASEFGRCVLRIERSMPGTEATPFLARAPSSNPGPGRWKKLFDGDWSEPGVGGKSSPVAYWTTTVSVDWVKGGIGLRVSADPLHFTPVFTQPLLLVEPGDWGRRNGLELVSYPDLIDAKTGLNQLATIGSSPTCTSTLARTSASVI
jgi:hypothetical protein